MKRLFVLCLCTAIAGCSEDSSFCQNGECETGVQSGALHVRNLGELGGAPWADADAVVETWGSPDSTPNGLFGARVGTGNFRNYAVDVISSRSPLATAHGTIYGRWGTPSGVGTSSFVITRPGDELDAFGYDFVTGNFCEGMATSKRIGDILIASMPTAGTQMQGGISIWGWNKSWKLIRDLKTASPLAVAGTSIAVGDVDGDGTLDLVYASMPLDESYNYLPGRVSVALDICNQYGTLTEQAGVSAPDSASSFGHKVVLASLNGTPEILVIDNTYMPGDDGLISGAIDFYAWKDGALVPSRPRFVGPSGAAIESVATADIDGDGALDLIVGEPMFQTVAKREGRVEILRNPGAGMPFSGDDVLWSAAPGRGGARFGSSVVIDDVNHDGRPDLIVGAPGFRASESTTGRAQAYTYVYMGTQTGLSQTPYWTYVSNVATAINDDFGRDIAVAQLDASGWSDLIIGAPYASTATTQIDNLGRVDIFSNRIAPCYTADTCLIDHTCYASGTSGTSACQTCDPSRDNFAWSDVLCPDSGNACAPNLCDETLGCTSHPLPDGSPCAAPSCTNNLLVSATCVDTVCTPVATSCGNYRCHEQATCMTTCTSDDDCYIGTCVDHVCTLPDNGLPVIVLADHPAAVAVSTPITLDASQSYDPDGGRVSFIWWSPDVQFSFATPGDTSVIQFDAPATPGLFSIHLAVVDDEGLTATRDIDLLTTVPLAISSPTPGDLLKTRSLDVSGTATPGTPVDVQLLSNAQTVSATCTTLADPAGLWNCHLDAPTTIPSGNYVLRANIQNESYDVPITLDAPLIPDQNGDIQATCAASPIIPQNAWWFPFITLLALIPLRKRKNTP